MPRHIERVIALKGDNEYREGTTEGVVKAIRSHNSIERRVVYRRVGAGKRACFKK